jgi:predicted KAP-like P-loop ATPase
MLSPELSIFGLKLKFGELRKLRNEKPLEKQKEIVNRLLKGIGRRILIIIDDIDRLDADETKLIFKLVKITGNFINTVFLLAYEREKVCQRISEQGIAGEEYLKKIVQVSFCLPKPDPKDLYDILFRDIEVIAEGFGEKYQDGVRWGNLFHSGFKDLFPTIRDIKRYINSIELDLEIIGKDEVNPIDFLGIEAIRVFAPEAYSAIGNEKRGFATTESFYIGSDSTKERDRRKEICEEAIKKSPHGLEDVIKSIILQLFPQVKGIYSNTHYGNDWQQKWRQELRVCSEEVFDKYFSLSIPSTALSEKYLTELISSVDDIRSLTENLNKFKEENKLRLVLDRLLDKLDTLNDLQKTNLLVAVFDYVEAIKDIKLGVFDLQDIDTLTLRLGYQTIKKMPREKRLEILNNILKMTNSIFSPIHLI